MRPHLAGTTFSHQRFGCDLARLPISIYSNELFPIAVRNEVGRSAKVMLSLQMTMDSSTLSTANPSSIDMKL